VKYIERFPKGVYVIDFEFHPADGVEGNKPDPVCLVALNYLTGQVWRYWRDELRQLPSAPFPCGDDALTVAYYASAEMDCFLALGWPLPVNLLDLYCEFRVKTNGLSPAFGAGLIGALLYFDFPSQDAADKDEMRQLILSRGPWSPDIEAAILAYCQRDVDALRTLLAYMYPMIDWPRALLRGRYMMAVSRMQDIGVPIDVPTLKKMQAKWDLIQDELIAGIDHQYGVFEGRTFKAARWADYLERHRIPWPRLPSGELDLKDDTFRGMAKAYPQVAAMRELRSALSELRLSDLRVGDDGRNRCLLSPFRSKTGRNQPSNTRFIFGPSVWLRSLIQPRPGWAVAYIDYCQQEFGIAAALSGDQAMMDAYRSGDPYLAFAKQAGAVPANATKATHKSQRELFKQCVLAVQYGMGAESLAEKIGQPVITARWLLDLHRSTYRAFWRWSDDSLDEFSLHGRLWTTLGWELRASGVVNPRSVRNFPMQANGAEILRLACIYLTEAGIRVCAPVHDAVLIESRGDALEATVNHAMDLMLEASAQVLGGFPLACDVNMIRHPDRYIDERGQAMWDTVIGLVGAEQH
jgi:DNA polymerase-1